MPDFTMKEDARSLEGLSWLPRELDPDLPSYKAISHAIRRSIDRGELSAGFRLPPQRDLADALGVTVGTISRAYRHAEGDGLVRGEVGRGTYVAGAPAASRESLPSRLGDGRVAGALIDLSVNVPISGDADALLREGLRSLLARPGLEGLMAYQPHRGSLAHRSAGVQWLARTGIGVASDQVLVTAGAQHGIFVTVSVLARPGDVILAEALTYTGIRSVCDRLGLRLIGVPADGRGMRPDALEELCRAEGPKAIYCVPTNHNPTTVSMDGERRRAIVDVAARYDVHLIEDDVYGVLATEREAPSLFTLYPAKTMHVSGLSKAIAPGLRVGFLAAPPELIGACADVIRSTTWMAPPLLTELAAGWIEDGTVDTVIERRRATIAALQAAARAALSPFGYCAHDYAMHGWLPLPDQRTELDLVPAAQRRGVLVSPAALFAVNGEAEHGIRVSFGATMEPERVADGCRRLADVLTGHFDGAVPTF